MGVSTRAQVKALENQRRIALHNASSPLLSLPAEIQSEIYSYILGGHLIRIEYSKDKIFLAQVCRHESYGRWLANGQLPTLGWLSGWILIKSDILFVCKDITALAEPILWSQNTFSFMGGRELSLFIYTQQIARGNHCLLAMRKVHFELRVDKPHWDHQLKTCAREMPNLTTVYITSMYLFYSWKFHYYDFNKMIQCMEEWENYLKPLATLPLRKALIRIPGNELVQTWTEKMEKQLLKQRE